MFGICGIVGKQHSQLFNSFKKTLEFTKCDSFEAYTFHDCSIGIAEAKKASCQKTNTNILSSNGISVAILGSIINKLEMGHDNNTSSNKIILDLYRSKHLSNLKNANGSFLFVIWDEVSKKLLIGCDRHGTRRLFYRLIDGHFCFSTKMSGLSRLGTHSCKIDKDSMLDLMVFGYILQGRTLASDIKRLPFASILEFNGDSVVLSRYWDWHFDESLRGVSEGQLQEEMIRLMCQAVERSLDDTDSLLLPLSGGLDSRAILGVCMELGVQDKITAFTYGECGSYDLKLGADVAHNAGVRHLSLLPDMQDFAEQFSIEAYNVDGMIEVTPFYPALKYQHLRNDYTTVLSGQVGGSLFSADSEKSFSRLCGVSDENALARACLQHHALNDFDQSKRILGISIDEEQYLDRSGFGGIETYTPKELVLFMKYWNCSQRLFCYTPFCNCRFEDLFEYRSPFLDKDLVDFSLRLPQDSLIQQNLYRKALLSWQPDLFAMPTSRRSGLSLCANKNWYYLRRAFVKTLQKASSISSRLIKRNITSCKTNKYIDYDDLLRHNMIFQKTVHELLEEFKTRGLCDTDYLESLWSLHLSGKKNFYRVFSVLLTYERSLKTIID